MRIVNILFQGMLAVCRLKIQENPQENPANTLHKSPSVPKTRAALSADPRGLERYFISMGWSVEDYQVDDKEVIIKATKKVGGGTEVYSYHKAVHDGTVTEQEGYQFMRDKPDLNTDN